MFDATADLITIVEHKNSSGDVEETQEKRTVFVTVRSVGAREVYEHQAHELKPSIVFSIANRLDYNGEEFVAYNGKTYKVVHVLTKYSSESVELICGHMMSTNRR